MIHRLLINYKIWNAIALMLALQMPVFAQDSWQQTGLQMKLMDLLDREDGYCLDVVGSGNQVRFDVPLIAHNCKPGLYADESVIHNSDGTILFPAYGGCVTVMGLNNDALPYNVLMIKKCLVDEPFLKSTRFQKFSINGNNQIQLEDTALCITVGDISRQTYSAEHRWRSLYVHDCASADDRFSQWQFIKP